MFGSNNVPLQPRNGHTLVVGIVARISGCASQKEVSLDDQVDHGKEVIVAGYSAPIEWLTIATKGKGERLDRPELQEIETLIQSGRLDVLEMDDVGRLVRGGEAVRLWGMAVDHGVRCIAPNDGIDTADDGWEEALLEACAGHISHNAHTSRRLKQKLMNRFKKGLGATSLPIAGLVKPDGATTFDDWKRDDSATPMIQAGLKMLRETRNCCAVADFFNAQDFPVGPYCKRTKWDGRMVRRYYKNSLLAGRPHRGERHTIKHHATGRRISVPNTDSAPVLLDYPHLAHVDFDEQNEVNALLVKSNKDFGRKLHDGVDALLRRPRKRTRCPGQHARCWYCGREFVWGGNGVTANLMCAGPRNWNCWNSISINGEFVVNQLLGASTAELFQLDGFDDQFAAMFELASQDSALPQQRAALEMRQRHVEHQRRNLFNALAELGPSPELKAKHAAVEAEAAAIRCELQSLEARAATGLCLPRTAAELRQPLLDEFERLAKDSFEFAPLMKRLVPEFYVYLVRLCSGGLALPP